MLARLARLARLGGSARLARLSEVSASLMGLLSHIQWCNPGGRVAVDILVLMLLRRRIDRPPCNVVKVFISLGSQIC